MYISYNYFSKVIWKHKMQDRYTKYLVSWTENMWYFGMTRRADIVPWKHVIPVSTAPQHRYHSIRRKKNIISVHCVSSQEFL